MARAIEAVGGPTKAANLLGRSTQAIHKMRARGYCDKAVDAVRLARASHVSVAELAGIPDEDAAPDAPASAHLTRKLDEVLVAVRNLAKK